ncbi:MAG: hypothetical protein ACOZCP_01160 [Pseudomonadota bacterium]
MEASYLDKSSGYFSAVRGEMPPYVSANAYGTLDSVSQSGTA